ncbi:MAG: DUF3427 domain-containing protein [Erysipelotrichaceae bacterium]|nr:DUF3427 domain-containing protein [Erysipelotrichaceae bacterium]
MNQHFFLSNESEVTFLDRVLENLRTCIAFDFCVSFIKKPGLDLILEEMELALKRGAKGRVITSAYQNFTDILSLKAFLRLQNAYEDFSCRFDLDCFGENGFHTKGYFFVFDGHKEYLIGSSNITLFALKKNKEWDVAVMTGEEEKFVKDAGKEFDKLWKKTLPLTKEIIDEYYKRLKYAVTAWDMDLITLDTGGSIRPNSMQAKALKELARYRNLGLDKSLVVASTGSGKTYLSAFDARNFGAKKLLYVVHRDSILLASMKTFATVFGSTRTYGLYNGDNAELDRDFIFASNVMLAKHLSEFDPYQFDYIIIDEVHHAAASTYRKIMAHFKPAFMLGLTATPERMDDESVYELFGNNVPFDLRLREALENHLVCPFKYYGIRDTLVDYAQNNSKSAVINLISQIASDTHCEFVREKIEEYRPSGKLKAIAFCRNVDHARMMAEQMAKQGYNTTYLTGNNSTGEREKAFADLQSESEPLEIIFAIDILNEGIDIPAVNMVLFLRPTESSIVFLQQLGRGLRLYEDKPFLTVLDFIGNSYNRSALIAKAFSSLTPGLGSRAAIAELVTNPGPIVSLPEVEIRFDSESRDEVLKAINNTNFNAMTFLKQDYENFKAYLGLGKNEYPTHMDYLDISVASDLLRFIQKSDCYYSFLETIGVDLPSFTEEQIDVMKTISWHLPLARKADFAIIQALLDGPMSKSELKRTVLRTHSVDEDTFHHAVDFLQDKLYFNRGKYHKTLLKESGGQYELGFDSSNKEFRKWIVDILNYGLARFDMEYPDNGELIHLYGEYDATKIYLALNSSCTYRMGGVNYTEKGLVINVTLQKEDSVEAHLKYEDRFLSAGVLQWESQTGTTLKNTKGKRLISEGKAMIFVRRTSKENGAAAPYTYIGWGKLTKARASGNPNKTLLFDVLLEKEVPDSYRYAFSIPEKKYA